MRNFISAMLVFGLVLPSAAFAAEKVLIDTDSAYFSDDVAAIAQLLGEPGKVDVVGITIVPGNTWPMQGVEYVLHILELLKRTDIPVHLGAQSPLIQTPERAKAAKDLWGGRYAGALDAKRPASAKDLETPFGGHFAATRPKAKNAIPFIIETIENNPGQVTVLALGPMTNLALALRQSPQIAGKIKRLVFMGGAATVLGNTTPAAELNIWFDPEAADIVLRSEIPEKFMFGLDITNHAVLTKKRFDGIVAADTPLTRIYREDLGNRFPGFYKNPEKTSFIWDCIPALYLVDPGFVEPPQDMWVEVDTQFGPGYGRTLAHPVRRGVHSALVHVMKDLNLDRFFGLYESLLIRPIKG